MSTRADTLLAESGLVSSRSVAAKEIRAGRVRLGVDGPVVDKPSQLLEEGTELLLAEARRFVSRAGIKLANALEALKLDVTEADCLDVGASTGGFTDCFLQRGAARVIALDVAHGQLDWGIRNDDRVTVIERLNARDLQPGDLPFVPTLAAIDVSFISAAKILPAVAATFTASGASILVMVKPQFELGRDRVGRGGVVRSPSDRRDAIHAVAGAAADLGLVVRGVAPSGLPGPKGNVETFLWLGDRDAVADLGGAVLAAEPDQAARQKGKKR
jgi:23S rRNA (cytidine1920-2'-O)/16S rRNA (cytidine1409-2'-O)-methyltransferase